MGGRGTRGVFLRITAQEALQSARKGLSWRQVREGGGEEREGRESGVYCFIGSDDDDECVECCFRSYGRIGQFLLTPYYALLFPSVVFADLQR